MEKNRGIIRELLKFEFELGHSAKEAIDNINRAKGNGTVSKATAYLWQKMAQKSLGSNLLLNSLILRTENGTAVGSTNSKNNGKK
uniref:Mos1 transposase HTH domain-containing protein n=1 Tax=Acrobeloides nanus TaxID=290746 RepID=A0A914CZ01_9BILA